MDVNPPSYMGICKKEFTWNNLLDMFGMNPSLFFSLINFSMVLRNILEIGMPKCIIFFLTPVFLDVILC
jgi:hypothetical protein